MHGVRRPSMWGKTPREGVLPQPRVGVLPQFVPILYHEDCVNLVRPLISVSIRFEIPFVIVSNVITIYCVALLHIYTFSNRMQQHFTKNQPFLIN